MDEREENWDNMAHGTTYSAEETKILEDKWTEEDRQVEENEESIEKQKEMVEAEQKERAAEEEEKALLAESLVASSKEKEKATDDDRKAGKKKDGEGNEEKDKENSAGDQKRKGKADDKKSEDDKPKNEKAKDKPGKDTKPDENSVPAAKSRKRSPNSPPNRLSTRKEHETQTAIEKEAHLSFENCAKACAAKPEFFQYVHGDDKCTLGHSIRLGRYAPPGEGDRIEWRSGWNLMRIRKWTQENQCQGPMWPDWVY